MPTVKTFDRTMIKNYLESKEWNYLQDRDGDFQVRFARDEETGHVLTLLFLVGGEKNDVYTVRIFSDKTIPKADWGRVMMLCNEWNDKMRWPKAYLHINNPETDTTGEIVLEEQIDLEMGIHQELLNSFTDTVIWTANNFWIRAHQKEGL